MDIFLLQKIHRRFFLLGAVVAIFAAAAIGCGSGKSRYQISGQVTHNGEPVKAGNIAFEPLEQTGDKPEGGGFTTIEDGKFDTRNYGRGHLGGKTKITVNGVTDELIDPNDVDKGYKTAFPPYSIEIDLPYSSSTQDIDITP